MHTSFKGVKIKEGFNVAFNIFFKVAETTFKRYVLHYNLFESPLETIDLFGNLVFD